MGIFMIHAAVLLSGADITSLSQVFQLGHGIEDRDGDGFADRIALYLVVSEEAGSHIAAAAEDIAARVNLESLAGHFDLITRESSVRKEGIPVRFLCESSENPGKFTLTSNQGRVSLSRKNGRSQILITGGSPESLLKTSRAFFLRWPYLWDIWGREESPTYDSIERDTAEFLKDRGVDMDTDAVAVISAFYEFFPEKTAPPALKKLRFPEGECQDIQVSIQLNDRSGFFQARQALEELRRQHRRGHHTEVLNYAGCAGITFILEGPESGSRVNIPRVGTPLRFLTPGYQPVSQPVYPEKSFDILTWLSTRGILSDTNNDDIPDDITATIVIPEQSPDLSGLPSRLILHSAGASFPLVRIDSEIKDPAELRTPLLIGNNNLLVKELKKSGKLAEIPDESGLASARIVPAAFNKTDALVLTAGDKPSLSALTQYLTTTYPFLREYKKGSPELQDVQHAWKDFLEGKNGAAEAFFSLKLQEEIDKLQGLELASLNVRLDLPEKNPDFVRHIREKLKSRLKAQSVEIQSFLLNEGRTVFHKTREIPWEGEEAVRIISQNLDRISASPHPVAIELGVSESPEVRQRLRKRIERLLKEAGVSIEKIQTGCSYKPGFFWLREMILPRLQQQDVHRLLIKCAEITPEFNRMKRFYSDPHRWLYELYPIDDIISRETGIPLDRIVFEMVSPESPVYQVEAYDAQNRIVLQRSFTPPTRRITYMPLLPEWGEAVVTTGWVKISQNQKILLDECLPSDLEKFWEFFQNDVLTGIYRYIKKNTGDHPTFSNQPYFKQLKIDLHLSEPDFRLELDQERISSLEAVHDEIYFGTLDFLRGITEKDPQKEQENSRSASAPGSVLPVIHPSLEGRGTGRAEVLFEDRQSQTIQMRLEWEDTEGRTSHRIHKWPGLKAAPMTMPLLVYNGPEARIEKLLTEIEFSRERDYLLLIDLISAHHSLEEKGVVPPAFRLPGLRNAAALIRYKDLEKEEIFRSKPPAREIEPAPQAAGIPLDEIISPEQALRIARFLGEKAGIRTYIAGASYEGRDIPVLEIFTPQQKYVSLPRLITFKPTLFCSGRQHANEISATNYIFEFARRLAEDDDFSSYSGRINFVLHPMENPDGAAIACRLQKLTPEHSLHAGRYSSLGIDIGSQVYAQDPLLPEAEVRKNLFRNWKPDIYLNLHGYPSHEWVQPFSGYVPYLFRDYWIPRGWFVYYRALTLPLFPDFRQAGLDMKKFLIDHLNAGTEIRESNLRLYDRYYRWAARWQPHLKRLEIQEGVNIYSKRRSSRESWLTPRREITFIEETPEVMDETATGKWLEFLVRQGLTYLKAHADYLTRSEFTQVRVEEEVNDRIRIRFFRRRPGEIENR